MERILVWLDMTSGLRRGEPVGLAPRAGKKRGTQQVWLSNLADAVGRLDTAFAECHLYVASVRALPEAIDVTVCFDLASLTFQGLNHLSAAMPRMELLCKEIAEITNKGAGLRASSDPYSDASVTRRTRKCNEPSRQSWHVRESASLCSTSRARCGPGCRCIYPIKNGSVWPAVELGVGTKNAWRRQDARIKGFLVSVQALCLKLG
jgi:hypothetical protein